MKKTFFPVLLSCLLLLLSSSSLLQSSGMAGVTGAPGEGTCSGCHAGGVSGTTVSISSVPAFTNNQHIPNTTYTITITVAHPSQPEFGFDCEILTQSNTNAGTMSNGGTGVIFLTTGGKKNATHSSPKLSSGGASWNFEWTSPSQGDAYFYVAGNAVNGNNNSGGDSPATTSLVLTSSVPTALKDSGARPMTELTVFPNPCGEFTQLNYYLNSDQEVKAEICEINGKLIRTLLHEKQAVGPHSPLLDLKGISKGIYFIKVSAGSEKASQKIICVQ